MKLKQYKKERKIVKAQILLAKAMEAIQEARRIKPTTPLKTVYHSIWDSYDLILDLKDEL